MSGVVEILENTRKYIAKGYVQRPGPCSVKLNGEIISKAVCNSCTAWSMRGAYELGAEWAKRRMPATRGAKGG